MPARAGEMSLPLLKVRASASDFMTPTNVPAWLDGWTTVAASIVALLLGVRAEWRAWQQSRASLRVIPLVGFGSPNSGIPPVLMGLRIENYGAIAVSIDDVGFFYHGSQNRYSIVRPIGRDGTTLTLPVRLEPQSNVEVWGHPIPDSSIPKLRCGYVRTAAGKKVTGRSDALKRIRRAGRLPARSPLPHQRFGLISTDSLDGWNSEDPST